MNEEIYEVEKPELSMNRTRIDDDGVEMEWIEEKKAWFPKINDEFIYMRNLNYGFIDNEEKKPEVESEKVEEPTKEIPEWFQRLQKDFQEDCVAVQRNGNILSETEYAARWSKFYQEKNKQYEKDEKKKIKEIKKREAKPSDVGWFEMDEDKNRFVYVENLPLDITIEEFISEMGIVGMIMKDFHTNQMRARLYKQKDDPSKNKGDGIVCYLKVESVDLALDILDGRTIRGNQIKVTRAKFEQKEGFDPKRRRKMTNKEKKTMKEKQEKLFRWAPETKLVRPKKDNTVIMKNMFDYEAMKDNPEMVFDIKEKVKKGLEQIGGVKSVVVHELQPEGIVQVTFSDPNESDVAVSFFNNKLWNGRKITAELWDGHTRYKVKETEEQERERLAKWDQALMVEKAEAAADDGGDETD